VAPLLPSAQQGFHLQSLKRINSGDAAAQEETADLAEEAKNYLTEAEWSHSVEPMSDVVYPIVDKKRRTALTSKPGDEDKEVLVGLLSTAIYWRSIIKVSA
jgi:hypothetical protein